MMEEKISRCTNKIYYQQRRIAEQKALLIHPTGYIEADFG
jgi:hypothetical protein